MPLLQAPVAAEAEVPDAAGHALPLEALAQALFAVDEIVAALALPVALVPLVPAVAPLAVLPLVQVLLQLAPAPLAAVVVAAPIVIVAVPALAAVPVLAAAAPVLVPVPAVVALLAAAALAAVALVAVDYWRSEASWAVPRFAARCQRSLRWRKTSLHSLLCRLRYAPTFFLCLARPEP